MRIPGVVGAALSTAMALLVLRWTMIWSIGTDDGHFPLIGWSWYMNLINPLVLFLTLFLAGGIFLGLTRIAEEFQIEWDFEASGWVVGAVIVAAVCAVFFFWLNYEGKNDALAAIRTRVQLCGLESEYTDDRITSDLEKAHAGGSSWKNATYEVADGICPPRIFK